MAKRSITIALDWVPNPVHAGMLLAKYKGWYAEEGLQVHLLSPESDQYALSPIEKVLRREVDLGIGPGEKIIRLHQMNRTEVVAVASVLQKNVSAIACVCPDKVKTPADLDGKYYAALDLPYEKQLIEFLILQAGGKGVFQTIYPAKMTFYELLYHRKIDFAWIYKAVEGVEARLKGIPLQTFDLEDYKIPYGHCPIIAAHKSWLQEHKDDFQTFINLTTRGYQYAVQHPEETEALLVSKSSDTHYSPEVWKACLQELQSYFLDPNGRWGTMYLARWEAYVKWLEKQQLIPQNTIFPQQLFLPLEQGMTV